MKEKIINWGVSVVLIILTLMLIFGGSGFLPQ